jgi:dTDP-4-dehydrorhamnose reductase
MEATDKRILILGGRGMLGSDLAQACRQQGYEPIVLDLPDFDITRTEDLERAVRRAGLIVNCAAFTNVDGAESHAELAYQVNGEAVGRLGALARQHNSYVLHISTDFVFDGRSGRPYTETDTPNPINIYGKSKLAGEQLLTRSGCRHGIIRVEWTYGSAGVNFVTKLMQRTKTDKMLRVVDDQVGSPTATTEVAKAICTMLKDRPEGIFHFASAGYVSRYEMAKFIVNKLSMPIEVAPCKTGDFSSPAARPLNSRFDCSKIQFFLDAPIEPWQGPLERFLGQL